MSHAFKSKTFFNEDIGGWDTSSVTNMSYMFASSKFNKDISSWNTSAVLDMSYMFYAATSFNQNINTKMAMTPDGTEYIAWDVLSVENME